MIIIQNGLRLHRITVDLTTHDAGGITNNDVNLARILNSLI